MDYESRTIDWETKPSALGIHHGVWSNECKKDLTQWTWVFEWDMPLKMMTFNEWWTMNQWIWSMDLRTWMHHTPRINGLEWQNRMHMAWILEQGIGSDESPGI